MAVTNVNKELLFIVVLCLCWYITSSCNNVIGKVLLNEFPYPMTVTIAQLLSIALYSGPILKCMGVRPRKNSDISSSYYKTYVIPLSLGKFIALVFSHISIWKVPVSYAHTVKATMPLFTVILSRICLGEIQSAKVYASLLPIVIGVGIATITEIAFNLVGLMSALFSTGIFSLLHIYSKKVMNDTGIHHLRLLHLLGKLAFLLFLPIWLIYDGINIFYDEKILTRREPTLTLLYLFMDGFLNWIQNFIAFTILSRVSPLTYSVANASKRISVITASLFMIGNPVTLPNVLGMLLAILGVLGYNKSKYDDNLARRKVAPVPLSQVVTTFSNGAPTTFHPNSSKASYIVQNKRSSNGFIPFSPAVSMESISHYYPNPLQVAPFHPVSPLQPDSLTFSQSSKKNTSVFH